MPEPSGTQEELQLTCRRNIGLLTARPDTKQGKAIWVDQSAAELACLLDCAAQNQR